MNRRMIAAAGLLAISSAAAQPTSPYACTLETPVVHTAFKGDIGTTAFFDVFVGGSGVEIQAAEAASTSGTASAPATVEVEIYAAEGVSYVGLENMPGAWTLMATGQGLCTGNVVDPGGTTETTTAYMELDQPIRLEANKQYAFAVLYVQGMAGYWNGNGPNQFAQTSELRFEAGTVTLAPFRGAVFEPRVWGGRLHYSNCEASCVCDRYSVGSGVGVCDIFDFIAFQDAFVAGDPLACDLSTTTGSGVCDIFDFIAFQDAFTAGCQ